jgi:glutathione S-transferase
MKLHWSPRSPYVRKVMMLAHETGQVGKLNLVRSVVATARPHELLMRDNPLSKIPTLVLDDGTVLFDSVVICEYLNDLAGAAFFPSGAGKWPALRWHALGQGVLDLSILWRNEREREGAMRSEALIAAFVCKMNAALHRLNDEADALQAAPFAIGHVAVACALGYLDFRFDSIAWRLSAPRLARWFSTVENRDSYRATMPLNG